MNNVLYDIDAIAKLLEQAAEDAEVEVRNIDAIPLAAQCAYYRSLSGTYKRLDAARKRLYKQVDLMNKVKIPEALEDAGIDKIQVPEVATSFYPLVKYSASILDKERGFEYLRANNAEALITETVNASTLSGYLRDRVLSEGIDPPEDIFNLNIYRVTGMSRYTPK